jgi:hypothetical protein
MQSFRIFAFIGKRRRKNDENNPFDQPPEAGPGNSAPPGKTTNQGTPLATIVLGMYLTVQPPLPPLWKRLQEDSRHQ